MILTKEDIQKALNLIEENLIRKKGTTHYNETEFKNLINDALRTSYSDHKYRAIKYLLLKEDQIVSSRVENNEISIEYIKLKGYELLW